MIVTTKNYPEDKLVTGILNKDPEAFSYLYKNYGNALLQSIEYTISEKHTAEDILQNVFIKIYTKISLYDSAKGRLFTWMTNIAKNETCDMLRQKGYKIRSRLIEWESVQETESENPYDNIDAADIRRIVLNLTPDLRSVIELNHFYGYTHEEIAEILTMPLGTVKTKIRRAYGQIRTLVAN